MNARSFDAREPMQALLASWAARQWLRPLDTAFADFLWREVPDAPPFLILAAALASHQLGRGHACLDLEATLKHRLSPCRCHPKGTAQEAARPRHSSRHRCPPKSSPA
jgi:exodeoxyribonuclease V alpha subunit